MKKIYILIVLAIITCCRISATGFSTIQFPIEDEEAKESTYSYDELAKVDYMSKLTIQNGTITLCTGNGVYQKIYNQPDNWSLIGYKGYHILQYIENSDNTKAIALVFDDTTSYSLVAYDKLSSEYSPIKLYDDASGPLSWIAQNPFDLSSILVKGHWQKHPTVSHDFGDTWEIAENDYFLFPGLSNDYNPYYESEIYYGQKDCSVWEFSLKRHNKNSNWLLPATFVSITPKGDENETFTLHYSYNVRNCTFDNRKPECVWIAGDGLLGMHDEEQCLANDNPGHFGMAKFIANYYINGLEQQTNFVRILLDETHPDIAYAPGVEKVDDKTSLVIYKSTDGGINWSKIASEELADSRSRLLDNVMYDNKILMYLNGNRLIEFDLNSVAEVGEMKYSEDSDIEYYNLQGIKTENPGHGIYIKKQGNKSEKIVM